MSTQDHPTLVRRRILGLRHEWLAWALSWCAARGILLVFFADVFGYGEELEKGCAAKAMLDGLPVPHHQLAYQYYEGGGFVVSHLDALAFALFGESLLAIKLVALALGVATLGAGWKLCERLGGRGAARSFALLFVLAPASVQKLSVLALGIHFHALLFVALVLESTARIVLERDLRPRAWLKLGLLAGFGLYFSYLLALTIAVAATLLFVALRGERLRKPAWTGLLGFALGVSPLLWMAARVGREVLDIHGAEVVGEAGAAKLELLRAFFVSVFAGRGALDLAALVLLCAAPLLGLCALRAAAPPGLRAAASPGLRAAASPALHAAAPHAPRASASPALRLGAWLVLAHAGVFVLAYLASGFTVGRVYHYFVLSRLTPLWFFATLFTAFGIAAAWRANSTWPRALACAVLAGLSLAGVADLRREVHGSLLGKSSAEIVSAARENLATLAAAPGYAYPKYLYKISPHVAGATSDKLRVFLRFREPSGAATTLLHSGIALALYGDGNRTLAELESELHAAGIDDARGFLLGLGLYLRARFPRDIALRAHGVESEPPAVRDALIEGLGCAGLGLLATEDRVAREVTIGLDAQLPEPYFVGLGRRMHDAFGNLSQARWFEWVHAPWTLDRERAMRFIRGQPEPVASAMQRGYEAVLEARLRGASAK